MKKILILLTIGIVGFTSCKEELVQVYSISIDPTELSFNSGGGEETVSVTSTADWELSGDSYWCYASEYFGKGDAEIIFTADPNEDSESNRTATFTFISGDKKATLTVTQEKKEYSISIEPKELKFGADGGEQEITVTSSDEWEVKGKSDWCDLSLTSGKNGDKVIFSADPYTNTEEARTANYTFVCGDKKVELTVTQEAKVYSISVEPTELSYIAAGEEKAVTITSSDEWKFSSDEYWITTSEQSGENGAAVKIKVEANEDAEIRTGMATFRCGDKQADVKITQEAKEFTISIEPTEIEFEAIGGEREITVKSSDSWRLSTDNDWITTSAKTGSNGDIVKIIVDYTVSTEIRTGIITFTCGNKTAELTVTQNPDDSPIIRFKDPYFLETLLQYSSPTVDINGDKQISEQEAKTVTKLDIGRGPNRIRNMDEIVYFSSLIELEVSNCCDMLNVSGMLGLQSLTSDCPYTDASGCLSLVSVDKLPSVETLILKGCTALKELDVSHGTTLKHLDITGCTELKTLDCSYADGLTSLDLTTNAALEILRCGHCDYLQSLDLSKNISLETIDCSDCYDLTELKIYNGPSLRRLSCLNSDIESLDVSNCTNLTSLDCHSTNLTSLNVDNCPNLTTLNCCLNQLTKLNISQNTALIDLNCRGNNLTSLDASNNTALKSLDCCLNQLTSLNISGCTALTELDCFDNQLTSLDLSNNTALTSLSCYSNQLTSMDLSNNRNLTIFKPVSYWRAGYYNEWRIYLDTACPLELLTIYKYHILDSDSLRALEQAYPDLEITYVE